jgi:hypothetical protein
MPDDSNPTLRDFIERSLGYQCEIFAANLKVIDTRFEAIDERFAYFQQLMDERSEALKEAKSLAAESVNERLGLLQHFRASIDSDRAQYASAEKVEAQEKRIQVLETRLANIDGRIAAYVAAGSLVVTIVLAAIGFAIKLFT